MTRAIAAVIYREDDQRVARALNVDVSSFGDIPAEARRHAIQEALDLHIDDMPDVDVPQFEQLLS